MSSRGFLLLILAASLPRPALADHQPTEIAWPGWRVESGEELYIGPRKFPDYPLTHLFDGDPKTCWVYSGKADPKNDWVKPEPRLVLVPDWPAVLDGIGIINGYAKSDRLYRHNDRAARVRITLNGDDHGILPPRAVKSVHDADLADTLDIQKIAFKQQKVYCLRIDITRTRPGEVHDLCVSELEFYADGGKIDLRMPAVVRYTPGDECGCGTAYDLITRSGARLFHNTCVFERRDASGRYLADIRFEENTRTGGFYVVDTQTGRVVHAETVVGGIHDIRWSGRRVTCDIDGPRKSIQFELPPPTDEADATPPPDRPDYEDWQEQWAEGQWVASPAGRRLIWPSMLPHEVTERWARAHGVLGLSPWQIAQKFGQPNRIIENKSVDTKLYLYRDFSAGFHAGGANRQDKCDGWAPRTPNYEKWFAQPDL